MIVLFVSAKVGHRQTNYSENPLTNRQRVFCVYDVPMSGASIPSATILTVPRPTGALVSVIRC